MHKTKSPVRIPLTDRAYKLIRVNGIAEQTIFNAFTNQSTNRHLKEIMKLAEINKEICFHCSRNTFVTLALSLGIPIDVVSKIVGHTDIKTTQIYAKYTDTTKIKEMDKWNNVKNDSNILSAANRSTGYPN